MKEYSLGNKGPRANSSQLQGQLQCRMGENEKVPHRSLSEILEIESSSKRHEGSLQDHGVDEELRVHKEGAGNNTRA